MKKRLLFVVLAVMVAVLFVFVSCGDEESTTPATQSTPASESTPATQSTPASESTPATQSTPASESTPATDTTPAESTESTPAETTEPAPTTYSTKNDVKKDWNGKTLQVLACQYSGVGTAEGPWTIPEIKWGENGEKLGASSWGESMVAAVNDRAAKVKELYGIDMNWMPSAKDRWKISKDIAEAMTSEDTHYDIAVLRCLDAFRFVENNYCYDLGASDYIDFDNDYYSAEAYKMFTLAGHTLFADGSITFNNEELAYLLIYNKDMLKRVSPDLNLYDKLADGSWTYDEFITVCRLVTKDMNGNGEWDDNDMYGFGSKNRTRLYRHFGIKGFDVNEETGLYEIAFNKDATKLNTVIEKICGLDSAEWFQDKWGGDWGAGLDQAFAGGRVLFYTDVTEKLNELANASLNLGLYFSMGVMPFPKLDANQEFYATTITNGQGTLACIPKCTSDRTMSEYFFDVLFWTAEEYVMNTYYEYKMSAFDMETAEEDLQILKDYIWGGIEFDVASLCNSWSGVFDAVESGAVAGGTNNFAQVWAENSEAIETRLDEVNGDFSAYSDTWTPAE
jgi:hypothetical protein